MGQRGSIGAVSVPISTSWADQEKGKLTCHQSLRLGAFHANETRFCCGPRIRRRTEGQYGPEHSCKFQPQVRLLDWKFEIQGKCSQNICIRGERIACSLHCSEAGSQTQIPRLISLIPPPHTQLRAWTAVAWLCLPCKG